ncbi:hypothetical protein Tco_0544946 [Tanacetum coccineum]
MIVKEANRTIQLPRSFSTNMLDDDRGCEASGGLVRASSASATQVSMADIERYMIQRQIQQLQACESRKNVPRCCMLDYMVVGLARSQLEIATRTPMTKENVRFSTLILGVRREVF